MTIWRATPPQARSCCGSFRALQGTAVHCSGGLLAAALCVGRLVYVLAAPSAVGSRRSTVRSILRDLPAPLRWLLSPLSFVIRSKEDAAEPLLARVLDPATPPGYLLQGSEGQDASATPVHEEAARQRGTSCGRTRCKCWHALASSSSGVRVTDRRCAVSRRWFVAARKVESAARM